LTLRKWILTVLAVSAAVAFVSLGLWQLRRLEERRQQNSLLASRRFAPEITPEAVTPDTAAARFRRIRLRGVYDFSNEIIHTLRGRSGSPGVNILTPLRRAGTDTAILVNRGWVYAPDGITVDAKQWREADTLNGTGFVETFPTAGPFAPPNSARPRALRRLDRSALLTLFPYPIANYYVVLAPSDSGLNAATSGTTPAPSIPPRVEPVALDEGPHRNYAVQWFSFAAISIIGIVIFIRRA
jgi:surfeit locus 1 family protein